MKGHVRIAHLLIENGAYTNHIDKTDRIPLHYALEQGYYELANVHHSQLYRKNHFFTFRCYSTTKVAPGPLQAAKSAKFALMKKC